MISAAIINFLTIVGAVLAIGVAIDNFALDDQRKTVARYVFAAKHQPFGDFELAAIRGVLRIFFDGREFKFINLLAFSLLLATAFLAVNLALSPPQNYYSAAFNSFLLIIIFVFAIFIFYVPSLFITRFIYIDRSPKWPWTVPAFAVDGIASALVPMIIFALILSTLYPVAFLGVNVQSFVAPALTGLVISLFIASLHNIAFGLLILFGALARIVGLTTNLNSRLADNSRLRQQPFSYIALLIGLGIYGLQLVGW